MTVAPDGNVSPLDLPGVGQLLVSDLGTGPGYDDTAADPDREVATRLGLKEGGR